MLYKIWHECSLIQTFGSTNVNIVQLHQVFGQIFTRVESVKINYVENLPFKFNNRNNGYYKLRYTSCYCKYTGCKDAPSLILKEWGSRILIFFDLDTVINQYQPFLLAFPDQVMKFQFCGKELVEIKGPHRILFVAPTKGNLPQINKDIHKPKKAMIICFKFRASYK